MREESFQIARALYELGGICNECEAFSRILIDKYPMLDLFLRQITACIDWSSIRLLSNKKYTKTHNASDNESIKIGFRLYRDLRAVSY